MLGEPATVCTLVVPQLNKKNVYHYRQNRFKKAQSEIIFDMTINSAVHTMYGIFFGSFYLPSSYRCNTSDKKEEEIKLLLQLNYHEAAFNYTQTKNLIPEKNFKF